MLLFNGVVDREVVAEFLARGQEAAYAHPLRSFSRLAGAVEEVPCSAEILVLFNKTGSEVDPLLVVVVANIQTCPCAPPSGCTL